MISDNVKRVKENIIKACETAGRNPQEIELVGVTKTVDEERILTAIKSGITHVGENRVQEYLEKYEMFRNSGVKSSIIGHLQTNKVKYIIDKVDLIQSVDSIKLAKEIGSQAKKHDKIMDVLVEINIGEEESKFGISFDKTFEFIHEISEIDNICVKGIMSIPPILTSESIQREYFRKLYKIYIDIASKKIDNIYMDILSMGMSSDYCLAILEGANMVRVGTGIFGKR